MLRLVPLGTELLRRVLYRTKLARHATLNPNGTSRTAHLASACSRTPFPDFHDSSWRRRTLVVGVVVDGRSGNLMRDNIFRETARIGQRRYHRNLRKFQGDFDIRNSPLHPSWYLFFKSAFHREHKLNQSWSPNDSHLISCWEEIEDRKN